MTTARTALCLRITSSERETLEKVKPWKVSGNADQIQQQLPQLLSQFLVEPLESSKRLGQDIYVDNKVTARFEHQEHARELYHLLSGNKMVAFRNWLD